MFRKSGKGRSTRILGLLAAFVLLLSACSSSTDDTTTTAPPADDQSSSTSSTSSGATDTPPAEVERADKLVVGVTGDISSPDPHTIGANQFPFTDNVFDPLIRYVNSPDPEPALATSLEWNADGTELTIHLREGVKFHSGADFTSADVIFSFARIANPDQPGAGQARTMLGWASGYTAPDDYTVVATFDIPRPSFVDVLSFVYIADKSVLETGDPAVDVSGTGAYELKDWNPGFEVVLDRNEDYWRETAGPEQIVLRVVGDTQALSAQLEAGAIDIAAGLGERDAARVRDSGFTVLLNEFGPEFYYIGINVTNPPFDDPRVRQAMSYALNRARFLDSALSGIGEATATPWPPQSPAYDPARRDQYAFDLVKARALLDEAGVDELDFSIISTNFWPPIPELVQQYQADLATIGVNLTIEEVDVGRWVQEVAIDHTATMWAGGFAFSQYSPESLFAMAAPYRVQNNMPQFESPEFTAMVDRALSETDDELRLAAVFELTDHFLDEAYINPVARREIPIVSLPEISGYAFRLTGFMSWVDAVSSK